MWPRRLTRSRPAVPSQPGFSPRPRTNLLRTCIAPLPALGAERRRLDHRRAARRCRSRGSTWRRIHPRGGPTGRPWDARIIPGYPATGQSRRTKARVARDVVAWFSANGRTALRKVASWSSGEGWISPAVSPAFRVSQVLVRLLVGAPSRSSFHSACWRKFSIAHAAIVQSVVSRRIDSFLNDE